MFGLGIMEIAAIVFLALLLFGPKFFLKRVQGIQEGFKDFGKSFNEGKEDPAALPPGSNHKK